MNQTTRQHPNHRLLVEVQDCTKCMERFWTSMERLRKLDAEGRSTDVRDFAEDDHDAYLRQAVR